MFMAIADGLPLVYRVYLVGFQGNKAWAGREWFVVRKAEVRTAEDNTLIPHVRMGVEAREQVVTKKGNLDIA